MAPHRGVAKESEIEMDTEKVKQASVTLISEGEALSQAIKSHKAADEATQLFTKPLAALLNNGKNAGALDAIAKVMEAADPDDVAMFCDLAVSLASKLGAGDLTWDLTKGDRLAKILDAYVTLSALEDDVDPDILNGAETAVKWWSVQKEDLAAATKSGKGSGSGGTRGPGTRDHLDVLYVVSYTCEKCNNQNRKGDDKGKPFTARVKEVSKDRGYVQYQATEHWADCHKAPRPTKGTETHKGITEAIDAVMRAESPARSAQGGGFVFSTNRENAS